MINLVFKYNIIIYSSSILLKSIFFAVKKCYTTLQTWLNIDKGVKRRYNTQTRKGTNVM